MSRTYEPIATTTLSVDTATVTFSSIPGTYTDLILAATIRDTRAANQAYPYIRVNSDSGSNYSRTNLYGDGSAAGSNRSSNATSMGLYEAPGSTTAANVYGVFLVHFMNYSNTTTNKTVINRGNNNASNAGLVLGAQVFLWRNTAAINTISITGDTSLASGSIFTLYGIKAE